MIKTTSFLFNNEKINDLPEMIEIGVGAFSKQPLSQFSPPIL